MIILHDETGKVIATAWQRDRLTINNNNFIEIDEIPENKNLILDIQKFTARLSVNTYTVSEGQLLNNGQPIAASTDIDRAQLKAEYQATIDQLQNIENAQSPTNAQVITAVKYLARTIRLMLKLLARLLT